MCSPVIPHRDRSGPPWLRPWRQQFQFGATESNYPRRNVGHDSNATESPTLLIPPTHIAGRPPASDRRRSLNSTTSPRRREGFASGESRGSRVPLRMAERPEAVHMSLPMPTPTRRPSYRYRPRAHDTRSDSRSQAMGVLFPSPRASSPLPPPQEEGLSSSKPST